MTFWILATFLTLIAALCVLVPLIRKPEQITEGIVHDKALYHQRLKEIDKDEQLKRISSKEAEAARAEEGRRLISLSKASATTTFDKQTILTNSNILGLLAVAFVPLVTIFIYSQTGNPTMEDQSLASRLKNTPESQSIEQLLARAEAHLSKSPNDARGWSTVAPVYTRVGRYDDAVRAWSNVLRLDPDFPEVRSLLGEAILTITDGVIDAKSFKLFKEELKINPSSARARYYVATGLAQTGKHEQSALAWEVLLKGANSKAPWFRTAYNNMNEQRQKAGLGVKPEEEFFATNETTAPGPSKQQIEDAAQMSNEDRAEMIENMVSNLAEKLKDDPSDKQGWQRLIRAYNVLGKKKEALTAIDEASSIHKSDAVFLQQLSEQKTQLLKQ